MPIARTIAEQLERSSWIRRMFEEGARLKAERGAENVFDYTLGNPDVEPPPQVIESLRRVVSENRPQTHGYMPNAGYPEVREVVAAKLRRETGLEFTRDHIFMTVGSSGACNVLLKSILDPGDEVIVLMPCFSEYPFYVTNHAGRMAPAETTADFLPDIDRIAAAVTPRTRAIILNTPNNPTGRVYPESALRDLNSFVERSGQPITVISDEPYKNLVFDGRRQPEVSALISNCAVCNSWSKSQAIAGERIGYLALSPRMPDLDDLRNACAFTNRILGFINAPAVWQWAIAAAPDATVDVASYQEKRDLLCDALTAMGYHAPKPEGSYYVFARTPIPDDLAFVRMLVDEGILAVPGVGFGRSGYMRLSLTIPRASIERSMPGFQRAFERAVRLAGTESGT